MMASGFAAMGYEIVWTQQSSSWLGHESAAVLAVVAAFFGGLALGALTLGARVEATSRPVHWYIGCELVVARWSLVVLVNQPGFSPRLRSVAVDGDGPGAIGCFRRSYSPRRAEAGAASAIRGDPAARAPGL
jgi:hypothetical protein